MLKCLPHRKIDAYVSEKLAWYAFLLFIRLINRLHHLSKRNKFYEIVPSDSETLQPLIGFFKEKIFGEQIDTKWECYTYKNM